MDVSEPMDDPQGAPERSAVPMRRSVIRSGVGILFGVLLGYLVAGILGICTGVIAMCSWSPSWWDPIYIALSTFLIFVVGPWLGWKWSAPRRASKVL